jgi:hypothetical protein
MGIGNCELGIGHWEDFIPSSFANGFDITRSPEKNISQNT